LWKFFCTWKKSLAVSTLFLGSLVEKPVENVDNSRFGLWKTGRKINYVNLMAGILKKNRDYVNKIIQKTGKSFPLIPQIPELSCFFLHCMVK